jgi:hypothetical protein
MKMKLEKAGAGKNIQLPVTDLSEVRAQISGVSQEIARILGLRGTETVQIVLTSAKEEYILTLY